MMMGFFYLKTTLKYGGACFSFWCSPEARDPVHLLSVNVQWQVNISPEISYQLFRTKLFSARQSVSLSEPPPFRQTDVPQ